MSMHQVYTRHDIMSVQSNLQCVFGFSVLSFFMFSVADFPAGHVRVTVYSNGVPLSKAQLQYYSNMEEITCLLARAADPVDFMCQVKPLKGCFKSTR